MNRLMKFAIAGPCLFMFGIIFGFMVFPKILKGGIHKVSVLIISSLCTFKCLFNVQFAQISLMILKLYGLTRLFKKSLTDDIDK